MATKEQAQAPDTDAQQAAFEHATAEQPSHYDPDGRHREADANDESQTSQSVSGAQPPVALTGLRMTGVDKIAGGVPAIISTMKYAFGEMGALRSLRTLARVNQPDGFDCPGCAWPEPDAERAHIEFCENGAKHVADEATTKRVTPDS